MSSSRFGASERGEGYSDEAGDIAEREAVKAGDAVTGRRLISDDAKMIRREVRRFLSGKGDVLLLIGGTGVSSRDVTVETVRPFFEKELEGFGELLRTISYDEIGTAAMLTRATAGVTKGKLIVCLPGSPSAVQTALKNFLTEFPHALYVARS